MEEATHFGRWDELMPDTLGIIFSHLSLKERLTVIPRVCKSWSKAINGPYCWQEIDIEEWSHNCEPDQLDPMVEMLITRSSGSLRKLCVSGLQSERIFTFIAENAGSLRTLRMPRSHINDSILKQIIGRLSMISFLDVSYCMKIGSDALEIIGKNCKLLEGLCRNMHPADTAGRPLNDVEAQAIAFTMPKLKHLEMAYSRVSTAGVLKIHSSCPKLEFLDLRGCWGVKLESLLVNHNFPSVKVLGPSCVGYYETVGDWDDSSDADTEVDHIGWGFVVGGDMDEYDDVDIENDDGIWDDEGQLEELEYRFYQEYEEVTIHWPPSP